MLVRCGFCVRCGKRDAASGKRYCAKCGWYMRLARRKNYRRQFHQARVFRGKLKREQARLMRPLRYARLCEKRKAQYERWASRLDAEYNGV